MKISDLQTGFRILSRLPLANSHQAQLEINNFLDSMLQAPPPADVYLQLLEQTRISLCFIEEQLAREYTGKALPLNDLEEAAFRQVVATWLKASHAYAHCAQLQAADDGENEADRLALILHRCIYYTGMAITEHHRARRQLPHGIWLNLHGFYASAEEWGGGDAGGARLPGPAGAQHTLHRRIRHSATNRACRPVQSQCAATRRGSTLGGQLGATADRPSGAARGNPSSHGRGPDEGCRPAAHQ
ncbi:hypothetical protein E4Q23_01420 [Candidatus Accumulibacter phosphatis]|uniref:Uncharacterized protein n=1 Tax=Candidatus Accumulibacter phosphatis TaxID=327160 RepID=A0ABX1TQN2_9PROT|nr:hypothetical protein [Candidatus Accumulibacter phosphatis]NMQ26536.1 hypothetical protein [Candidatus Accumulibacter phosphatis]